MANDIYDWSATASDNDDADSTINWIEGQLPGTVNGSARAMMKRVKELLNDLGAGGTVGGTGDAITLTSAIASLGTAKIVRFIAGAANTGPATLAVNGLTAKAIRKISGGSDVALAAGDILAGETYTVVYRSSANSAAGAWVLVGAAAVAAATTTSSGIVELATRAETNTGTDTSRAVVPANLYFPTGHLYGLTLSNNGSDATNDIDIAAGTARDATDTINMIRSSTLTKQIDASWAVGSAAGGLDTGSVANTTYYIWLIIRSDTGVVDMLFSTSSSSPTMPTNYDYKKLLGYLVRAGGVNGIPVMINRHPEVELMGTAPVGACRAWVNFNGTGTVAIRGSFNVSSITDNGTGKYVVNFTTAMPDANYAPVVAGNGQSGVTSYRNPYIVSTSTSGVTIETSDLSSTLVDPPIVSLAVFR